MHLHFTAPCIHTPLPQCIHTPLPHPAQVLLRAVPQRDVLGAGGGGRAVCPLPLQAGGLIIYFGIALGYLGAKLGVLLMEYNAQDDSKQVGWVGRRCGGWHGRGRHWEALGRLALVWA